MLCLYRHGPLAGMQRCASVLVHRCPLVAGLELNSCAFSQLHRSV
jgi:hypothetical protein